MSDTNRASRQKNKLIKKCVGNESEGSLNQSKKNEKSGKSIKQVKLL